MPRRVRGWALIGWLAVSGCGLGTEPEAAPIPDAELSALAAAAVDRAGPDALSLERLLRRMHETLQASGGNPRAQELLDASALLARQSREAAAAGDKARAQTLAAQSQAKLLDAVVLVLGPGVAVDAVTAARAALADFRARLAGKTLSDRLVAQLAGLEQRLAGAEAALAAGRPAEALGGALAVGNELRALAGLDGVRDAAKVIEEAAALLARAKSLAGSTPSAEVAAALARAEQLLGQARAALQAGDQTTALKLATESAAISRTLAEPKRQPPDPARVIEEAAALLARAKSSAGPTPPAEVAAALAKAGQLLDQARAALAAGDVESALRLASESAAISKRLIQPDREPPDPAKAIEEAAALLARAKSLAGATPSVEVAAALAKAGQLLDQARAALQAGDGARALTLASESAAISRRLIPTDRKG